MAACAVALGDSALPALALWRASLDLGRSHTLRPLFGKRRGHIMWALAARWRPRATRGSIQIEAAERLLEMPGFGQSPIRRPLHQPRSVPTHTLVEHVLGLRVLVCQHVRGETPFAQSDLSDLSAALEKFVETYELGAPEIELEPEVEVNRTPIKVASPPKPPPVALVEPDLVAIDEAIESLSEPEPDDASPLPSEAEAQRYLVVPPPSSVRVTPKAKAAAERFVEWVQLTNRCATYSSEQFRELYLAHCAAEDLIPLADNILRPALWISKGVTKLKLDSGRKRRSRERHFLWRIDNAPSATVGVPWPELPLSTGRRVA